MSDPAWELQKAILSTLEADPTLISLMSNPPRVYDSVPENAKMPYIQLDEPGTAEWDVTPTESDEGYGKEHTAMIHVWSSYEGKKEINAIMRAIEIAFRNFAPDLEGHHLANFRFQFSDRLRDPDGQSWHGVIQFRGITEDGVATPVVGGDGVALTLLNVAAADLVAFAPGEVISATEFKVKRDGSGVGSVDVVGANVGDTVRISMDYTLHGDPGLALGIQIGDSFFDTARVDLGEGAATGGKLEVEFEVAHGPIKFQASIPNAGAHVTNLKVYRVGD